MTASIADVKARHEKRLMAESGVVSVGIGQDAEGRPVIVVGVEGEAEAVARRLPSELDGHPLCVRSVGQIRAR
ncbi:MAG: hypothetical protein ABFS46_02035 [Myxococcota bacterium]